MYLILLDGSLDRVYKPLLLKRKVSRSGGPQWGTAESEIKVVFLLLLVVLGYRGCKFYRSV